MHDMFMTTMQATFVRFDASFKFSSGIFAQPEGSRSREYPYKGGVVAALDEFGRVITYGFCKTKANKEIAALLEGIKRRHQKQVSMLLFSFHHTVQQGWPIPQYFCSDNCCQVRAMIQDIFGPTAWVGVFASMNLLSLASCCRLARTCFMSA